MASCFLSRRGCLAESTPATADTAVNSCGRDCVYGCMLLLHYTGASTATAEVTASVGCACPEHI